MMFEMKKDLRSSGSSRCAISEQNGMSRVTRAGR
jgi:hypothetical protein